MEIIIAFILAFVLGFLIGILRASRAFRKPSAGNLRVDTSDQQDGPYMFLELTEAGAKSLKTAKQVTLDVKLENYISQK